MRAAPRWEFYIDRGGTFTDCIARSPAGELSVIKVPSSDEAPLIGMRHLLGLEPGAAIPACEVRLGTTLGTNALLERRGTRSALVVSEGFGSLLDIGDQTRPELFALEIEKVPPLPERVLEVAARLTADGQVLCRPDPDELRVRLRELRAYGVESIGIAVLNDYRDGQLEYELAELARGEGFAHAVAGHELCPNVGYLVRASTTAVDAYLTPLLQNYLGHLKRELPGSRLLVMQSSGGLCDSARFRGAASVLSGPAGGVFALGRIAEAAGERLAVGLDMGGTSTDVSRFDGEPVQVFEAKVGGSKIAAPLVDLHTIAAGGGSICKVEGGRFRVGPESVGAVPGPLCHGHAAAHELSLSDVNLALGRLVPDRFPLPLVEARALTRLSHIADSLSSAGHEMSTFQVAEGFFEVACESMAQAIREVTTERGFDVREHALVVFGGAGGQHACSLVRLLGLREVLLHPLAGALSALGIGVAPLGWDGSADGVGATLGAGALESAEPIFRQLEQRGSAALLADGARFETLRYERRVDLRYFGTETTLSLAVAEASELERAFERRHLAVYGHVRPGQSVEVAALRVRVVAPRERSDLGVAPAAAGIPRPVRHGRWFFHGAWREHVPIFHRESLPTGFRTTGPAIIADATSTLSLEPGFELRVAADGLLRIRASASMGDPLDVPPDDRVADPVLLEVFANRFMSIAEQMGRTLERTACSVNIRERLDFSCAVFDHGGELIANAPHIPVHLGAMSESVKAVVRAHPRLEPLDVFVTNDPALGGSHLPDITVVVPVFDREGSLCFFTAARGHHADVGGITPGSMPACSKNLSEEGVVFRALRVARGGAFDHELVRSILTAGPYPARRPHENLADLQAQIAAAQTGARLLLELCEERSTERVARYMGFVQDNAAEEVANAVARLGPLPLTFADAMDDGSPVVVTLFRDARGLTVDFSGTGPAAAGNLNAPRAVTLACVLYFLRVLVGKPIPLNSGCLRAVSLYIPEPSLLSPEPWRAVAGGNVETSQRVTDVLFGAARLLAASQGTMNNLSFGDGSFGYYETIAGGAGAGANFAGASAVHTHMTNTRLTDAEVLERRFPVRVRELSVRHGSGGAGRQRGGDGLCRELEFLAPLQVSLSSERRLRAPFGLAGGEAGAVGRNLLNGELLAHAATFDVKPGDRLRIETPGGGGYGAPARKV